MNSAFTPEFRKESEKIQDLIEPEVGMWFRYKMDDRDRLITGESQPEKIDDHRSDYTLYPSLEWLVEQLWEATIGLNVTIGRSSNGWLYKNTDDDYFEAETKELACLKALIKILRR